MQSSYLPDVTTEELRYVYCFLQMYLESVTTGFIVSHAIIEIKNMLNSTQQTSYFIQFTARLTTKVAHKRVSNVIHLQSLLNTLNVTFRMQSDDSFTNESETLFSIPRQITGEFCLENQEIFSYKWNKYGKTLPRNQYAKHCETYSSKSIPRKHCHHVGINMTSPTSITWACQPINGSETSLEPSLGRGMRNTDVHPACVLALLLSLLAI